jgi:hypothetical protein
MPVAVVQLSHQNQWALWQRLECGYISLSIVESLERRMPNNSAADGLELVGGFSVKFESQR